VDAGDEFDQPVCDQECGPGNKYRNVKCVDSNNVQVDEKWCTGDKPVTTETCKLRDCNWSSGSWSSCTDGSKSRTVTCERDGYCDASTKPSLTADCSVAWTVGTWSTCSPECAEGSATRTVSCPSNSCTATKPSTSITCGELHPDMQSCEWDLGDWSKDSK